MRIRQLMEQNRDNLGMAGLSVAFIMALSQDLLLQVVVGVGVPLFVLVAGYFLRRELEYRFPKKVKKASDENLDTINK